MAEILPFPSRTQPALDHFEVGDANWTEDSSAVGVSLRLVATLATTPSRTLAELAHKVEVLVLRLAPTAYGSLCEAEAALLRSVSHDIHRVAQDVNGALTL
jgi:hypothetical protein